MTKIFYLMEKDVNPSINVIKVIVMVIGNVDILGMKRFGVVKGDSPI